MAETTKINCPKCGHEFNVEDVLAHQIEEKYREELNASISRMEIDYKRKENSLLQKEQDLKLKSAAVDQQVEARLKIESERKAIEIKKQIAMEYEAQLKALDEQATEARKQVQEFKKAKIENEQLKRQLEEQKQNIELECEQRMTEQLKQETLTIKKREADRVEMKLKERDEVINAMKAQMEDMKRRAEQGSMQLQGEVQEVALEEILRNMFAFDLVEEVGKGIKGADVIHTVRNKLGVDCGKILYESKRTKSFNPDWLLKLKNDAGLVKADVYVIVTEVLPDGCDGITQKEGVWICSFSAFKGLVTVLRETLIRISEAYSSQTNKGEKMVMLYDYLMSNEFRLQVSAIVDGFTCLQDSYVKEKRAMERIWKEREKQLEKVLLNTNHFIGSIKGIAGSSLPDLKQIGIPDNILEFGD